MTKQEFEKLVGHTVPSDDFEVILYLYGNTDDSVQGLATNYRLYGMKDFYQKAHDISLKHIGRLTMELEREKRTCLGFQKLLFGES